MEASPAVLDLEATVVREVCLPEPPDSVVRFLRHNEALLHRILGADRVQRLSPAVYRLTLGRYGALGFSLRPALDLLFERADGLLLAMSSVGCHFLEGAKDIPERKPERWKMEVGRVGRRWPSKPEGLTSLR